MTVMEAMSRKVMTAMTNLIIFSQLNRSLKEKLEKRYLWYFLQTLLLHGTYNRMYMRGIIGILQYVRLM